MSTAIITSNTSNEHLTGIGHPEKPDRVTAVINKLRRKKNLISINIEGVSFLLFQFNKKTHIGNKETPCVVNNQYAIIILLQLLLKT